MNGAGGALPIRERYEITPLLPLSEWWHGLVFVACILLLVGFSYYLYRKDAQELSRGVAWSLIGLRLFSLAVLFIFLVNPERTLQRQVERNPRVPVLVDTSSSMAQADESLPSREQDSEARIDVARHILIGDIPTGGGIQPSRQADTDSLVERLREEFDVVIYRFDDQSQVEQIAGFRAWTQAWSPEDVSKALRDIEFQKLQQSQRLFLASSISMILAVGLIAFYFAVAKRKPGLRFGSMSLLIGTALLAVGAVGVCLAQLQSPGSSLAMIAGLSRFEPSPPVELQVGNDDSQVEESGDPSFQQSQQSAYQQVTEKLQARGTRTRVGDSINDLIRQEQGNTLAGILLLSDGQQTDGKSMVNAAADASDAGIRLFPIGLGDPRPPKAIQIIELSAPQRVYPSDKLKIKAVLRGVGLGGREALLELFSVAEDNPDDQQTEAIDSIKFAEDESPFSYDFEIAQDTPGKYQYRLVVTPKDESQDNTKLQPISRSISVEVVERKNRVLLIAGGPNRDYRFLRDQLFRDADVEVDIYLQTAKSGSSQEARQLLYEFPILAEQLNEYDCIVAFDPDWRELSPGQAKMLEQWIAQEAGGLIVTAGSVHTPLWTNRPQGDPTIDWIRRLYPITFYSQSSISYGLGRFKGEVAYPLNFTREGRSTAFLRLSDSSLESQVAWSQFPGVYGFYGVNEVKPGAVILAEFSDPQAAVDRRQPIYFASQFYGAGRVLFQASAEMWRLRAEDPVYFEQFYTKAIQWVSQGRLLRDSQRGLLLTDKTQCLLGEPITIQALLRDEQNQPLTADQVEVAIKSPDGSTTPIALEPGQESASAGSFLGRYFPRIEGDYRISLAVPGGGLEESLTADFSAQVPIYEVQRTQRNDEALTKLAEATDGAYETNSAQAASATQPFQRILDKLNEGNKLQEQIFSPATVDERFSRKRMIGLLALLFAGFSLEWTLRRLHRLA